MLYLLQNFLFLMLLKGGNFERMIIQRAITIECCGLPPAFQAIQRSAQKVLAFDFSRISTSFQRGVFFFTTR
jgi:hypothetical protein